MFSIIIPLYNKAPYIEKAVQSVLDQTCQDFELIVVDDGSTDDSLEKVQKFKSSKVRIIEQKNSGVSTARNNGIKVAKYDYAAFLDADDWWAPEFLEEMKTLITEFPGGVLYASSYFIVKNGKNRVAPIALPQNFESGYIDYIKIYSERLCMPVWTGATILKKNVFVCFLILFAVCYTGLFANEEQEVARMLVTLAEAVTGELIPKSISAWRNKIRYHREVQEGGAVIERISDLTTGICKTTLHADHASMYIAEVFIDKTLEAYNVVLAANGFRLEQKGSTSTWLKWVTGGIIVFNIVSSVNRNNNRTTQEFIAVFTVN
jgi:glycosyltransferase involved in cell wall biosynthesis